MIQALIIYSREGFEAFLIVAIIAAYLRKTGRLALMRALYSGIGAALLVSIVLGYFLMDRGIEPLWEGILGIVAVITVTSLVVHMWRTAPQMKGRMESRLTEVSADRTGTAAFFGVFGFTFFMITRE